MEEAPDEIVIQVPALRQEWNELSDAELEEASGGNDFWTNWFLTSKNNTCHKTC